MTFSGRATYDDNNAELADDVSPIVKLVAPQVTPFLDEIGDGDKPAANPYHTWVERGLNPQSAINSSAISSTAAASGGLEIASAAWIRVNDIFRVTWSGEHILVTSLGASSATIYVTRAYAGTSATSAAAGVTLEFLGEAELEGSGKKTQRAVNRVLAGNYVQTFREEINVSIRKQNSEPKGDIPSDFDLDKIDRTKECMRKLEKSVLMGRTAGNTIGTSSARTVMAGIYNSIATNIISHATFTASIVGSLMAQIDAYVDVNEQDYILVAGTTAKRHIDTLNTSKTYVTADTTKYSALITRLSTTFGDMRVVRANRLPAGTILVLKRDLIKVIPYAGESFAVREYDDGTHAKQGYILGTYTLEFRNEEAHGRIDGIA